MSEQPSLFDPIEAEVAKELAIAQVDENADPQWKQDMLSAIERLSRRLPQFTSDEVWEELEATSSSTTHEPRALGAVFKKASKMGLVSATGQYQPSRRVACHARPVRVWRSLVCGTL